MGGASEISTLVIVKMGGICSRTKRLPVANVTVNNAPSGNNCHSHTNGNAINGSEQLPTKVSNSTPSSVSESMDKRLQDPFSFQEVNTAPNGVSSDDINDGIPGLPRALLQKSRSTKSKQAAVTKVCLYSYASSVFLCIWYFLVPREKGERVQFPMYSVLWILPLEVSLILQCN